MELDTFRYQIPPIPRGLDSPHFWGVSSSGIRYLHTQNPTGGERETKSIENTSKLCPPAGRWEAVGYTGEQQNTGDIVHLHCQFSLLFLSSLHFQQAEHQWAPLHTFFAISHLFSYQAFFPLLFNQCHRPFHCQFAIFSSLVLTFIQPTTPEFSFLISDLSLAPHPVNLAPSPECLWRSVTPSLNFRLCCKLPSWMFDSLAKRGRLFVANSPLKFNKAI